MALAATRRTNVSTYNTSCSTYNNTSCTLYLELYLVLSLAFGQYIEILFKEQYYYCNITVIAFYLNVLNLKPGVIPRFVYHQRLTESYTSEIYRTKSQQRKYTTYLENMVLSDKSECKFIRSGCQKDVFDYSTI